MKLIKTASVAVLLLGMGLTTVESVRAQSREQITTSNSYTVAQAVTRANSPLYGSWKLTYSVNGIVYESVLIMNGYTGGMGTTYFDPRLRRTRVISQFMELRSSSQGLILVGSNPVDYHTKRPATDYSPDNFLFSIRPNGRLVAITCDRARQCSDVNVERVRIN
ncbi:RDD domain-containing protein [Calothrix sp. NIES-3974]|nr:RDD domain-containing protein [Calothrix sp. NIES-3974]